jgi:hypothetical protein
MTAASEVTLDEMLEWMEANEPLRTFINSHHHARWAAILQHLRSHRPEGREATREPKSDCCLAYMTAGGLCARCGEQTEASCTQASAVSDDYRDCPNCGDLEEHRSKCQPTPSAVSERVSDELTQHFQRISEDHARDLERSKSGRWRLTLAGQDIGHLLNYIERLRHGSGELVEAAKFIEQLREIRQFCAVPSRAGWAVALDGVIAALANHARLSPEGSDEASSHNQD